jgi:hypothetical protein
MTLPQGDVALIYSAFNNIAANIVKGRRLGKVLT